MQAQNSSGASVFLPYLSSKCGLPPLLSKRSSILSSKCTAVRFGEGPVMIVPASAYCSHQTLQCCSVNHILGSCILRKMLAHPDTDQLGQIIFALRIYLQKFRAVCAQSRLDILKTHPEVGERIQILHYAILFSLWETVVCVWRALCRTCLDALADSTSNAITLKLGHTASRSHIWQSMADASGTQSKA